MSTTYALTEEARLLADVLVEAGGVVDDELDARIEAYLESAPTKVDALHFVLERLAGEASWIREQEKALADRRRRIDDIRGQLRDRAQDLVEAHLELTGESKLKGLTATAYLRRSQVLSFSPDPTAWPPDLTKVTYALDKAEAKRRLKAGEELPNMELLETVSLAFRS